MAAGGSVAQTATILVTDLAGSTETRVRLGEDRAESVRREHDALLTEQASAHGGNVVKGLGDGVLVAFAGAAEALTAAVAMQQALHSYGGREGVALAMRVGISAGDVTFEGGDCFGTPVIEAARLCAAAAPGQILAAQLVELLARGRAQVELAPRDALELKGLPEPLDVCEVVWEPLARGVGLRGATPYVGREHEVEVLRECWQAAATSGSGGLALVAGEPGIGKTRLVSEVCSRVVHPGGGIVLVGGCHDGDVVANAPFVEALSEWVRSAPAEEATKVLGSEAPVVARMVPAIAEVLPEVGEPLVVPPDAELARLQDAVGQVLLRLASTAPVLLVLDDLHWADDATVGMLRAVSRATRRGPLLVVGTYRETDLDRRHPFAQALALLQREVEPTRLVLSGLDVADVQAMLQRIAEHEVPAEFASMLAAETEGNPFFLRETLLHLVEEGELRFERGVWTLAESIGGLGIPAGIRDVIGRRLSRLPTATNRLLAAGALFEVAFPLPVAATVVDLDEDDALDAIDAALEARIVHATEEFDQYAFTHALFRHALVEELNPSRQVRMHRAIATALEKKLRGAPGPALAAALARHYHRSAALPNAELGVPYALVVADDAARRYARREEYDALAVALELLPEGDERLPELQRRSAQTAVFANVGPTRVLEDAEAAGRLIRSLEGDDAACDFVAGLASECGRLDDLHLAWDVGTIARQWLRPDRRDLTYAMLRSFELAQRDFEDPEHPGVPLDSPERQEVRALVTELQPSESYLVPHIGSRAEAERARAARIAASSGDLMYPLWVLGAHRELCEYLHGRCADARARGVLPTVVHDCAILTRTQNVLGEYDAAQACLDEGLALLPRISETSNAAFQLLGASLLQHVVRGGLVLDEELGGFTAYSESPDVRWAWMAVTTGRGLAHAQVGNVDAALAVLHEVLPVLERTASWAQNLPFFLSQLAGILWNLERTDELAAIERNVRTKVVEPDVRYVETDGRWNLAQLCALDGRIDEAGHWFDEARRVLTEQGSEPLLVAVDYDEALMNVRLGGKDELARAQSLLQDARARCTHPALSPWAERIDALLQA